MMVDTAKLTEGAYMLHLEIKDFDGKICSKYDKAVKAVDGPAIDGVKAK